MTPNAKLADILAAMDKQVAAKKAELESKKGGKKTEPELPPEMIQYALTGCPIETKSEKSVEVPIAENKSEVAVTEPMMPEAAKPEEVNLKKTAKTVKPKASTAQEEPKQPEAASAISSNCTITTTQKEATPSGMPTSQTTSADRSDTVDAPANIGLGLAISPTMLGKVVVEGLTTELVRSGKKLVCRTFKDGLLQTPAHSAKTATVAVTNDVTLNMGNYSSMKLSVLLSVPCYIGEEDDAFEYARAFVDKHLAEEVKKVMATQEKKE